MEEQQDQSIQQIETVEAIVKRSAAKFRKNNDHGEHPELFLKTNTTHLSVYSVAQ